MRGHKYDTVRNQLLDKYRDILSDFFLEAYFQLRMADGFLKSEGFGFVDTLVQADDIDEAFAHRFISDHIAMEYQELQELMSVVKTTTLTICHFIDASIREQKIQHDIERNTGLKKYRDKFRIFMQEAHPQAIKEEYLVH